MFLKIIGPALSRINSVIISAQTVFSPGCLFHLVRKSAQDVEKLAHFPSTVSSPHHPKKGPIHKSLANPTRPAIYCGCGRLLWGKTDKPTTEFYKKASPRAMCESAPFWDDEVGRLLISSEKCKIGPKRKFSAGRPCGHPAKNFGQVLQILENKHFGMDVPCGRARKTSV